MSQFGLSSSNSHWGYGSAGAYPAYLPSCAAPAASQFNPPTLGFAGTVPDQTPTQDFSANNTGKHFLLVYILNVSSDVEKNIKRKLLEVPNSLIYIYFLIYPIRCTKYYFVYQGFRSNWNNRGCV